LEAQRVERKLSAIFAADVEGYSRLMGLDEVGTLRTLTAYRVIVDRLIASHRGRIFNTAGDSDLPVMRFRIGVRKAERGALIMPGKRQT
jgi:class 3 adenylate cyclase